MSLNAIPNMEVFAADVGAYLQHMTFHPSTVIVDPPRAGLGPKAIENLNQLKPEKIVYVSCNPISQAADCLLLSDYEILHLQPIDQFPHTPHVENVALLRRKT